MAAKLPFLSSDVGNVKEIIEWSNAGQLLPTTKDEIGWAKIKIEESAKELEKLIADTPKLKKMAEAGYSSWVEKFSWEKISKKYEELYLKLVFNG
jgi:glycosyltransferase involved in cell wall biosynthesis